MSTKTEPVEARDEKSKFFIFFPEIAYGKPRNVVWMFSWNMFLNTEWAYKRTWAAQPVNQKLEYSALIGLFTQACRTPAKFEFSPNGKEISLISWVFCLRKTFKTLLKR